MASSIVTSIADLNSLGREWDTLAEKAACPLFDHDWFLSCAETLHDESDLRIVTTRDHGVLTGVAPLVRESSGPGHHLVLLGATRLYEPSGWLHSSHAALHALAAAVLQIGAPVMLQRIAAASDMPGALATCTRGRGLTFVRTTSPSHSIDTRGSWDEFCSRMSRRTLGKLSKSLANAERMLGPSRVEELEPRPSDVAALLGTFASLECSGWKGRRGSSLAHRTDLASFFRSYCRRAAERGRLRMTQLSFGSQFAAAEVSIDAHGRRWGLKIGFRDDFAQHSPGLHLVHASIRATFERRLRSYEFLGVAEDWQRRWRPEVRAYHTIAIYPWSVSGLMGACRDAGAALWRRTIRYRTASKSPAK